VSKYIRVSEHSVAGGAVSCSFALICTSTTKVVSRGHPICRRHRSGSGSTIGLRTEDAALVADLQLARRGVCPLIAQFTSLSTLLIARSIQDPAAPRTLRKRFLSRSSAVFVASTATRACEPGSTASLSTRLPISGDGGRAINGRRSTSILRVNRTTMGIPSASALR